MKRIIYLLMLALTVPLTMAGQLWNNYIVNGNFENDDFTCFSVLDNGYIKEIGDLLTTDGSRCVSVSTSGEGDTWAQQFFVYTPQRVWEAGTHYRFSMKVRADKATTITAQAHGTPGQYIWYEIMKGSYEIGTNWTTINYEGDVTSRQSTEEIPLQTIAFMLNTGEANTIYFDDVRWETYEESPTAIDFWEPMPGDLIVNGNFEGSDYSNFSYTEGTSILPLSSSQVSAVGYMNTQGLKIEHSGEDTWKQFYVTTPDHLWKAGDKYRFHIRMRADMSTNLYIQNEVNPGQYNYYQMFGGNAYIGEEWTELDFEGVVTEEEAGQNGGFHTITIGLYNSTSAPMNFYIDHVGWAYLGHEYSEEVVDRLDLPFEGFYAETPAEGEAGTISIFNGHMQLTSAGQESTNFAFDTYNYTDETFKSILQEHYNNYDYLVVNFAWGTPYNSDIYSFTLPKDWTDCQDIGPSYHHTMASQLCKTIFVPLTDLAHGPDQYICSITMMNNNMGGSFRIDEVYLASKSYLTGTKGYTEEQLKNGIYEADTDISGLDPALYIEPLSVVQQSKGYRIPIKMRNTVPMTGFQFDLYLPADVTFSVDSDGMPIAELSTDRTTAAKTDYFNCMLQEDGSLRVLCNSTTNQTFEGEDGVVCYVSVDLNKVYGGDPTTDWSGYYMPFGEYPLPLLMMGINLSDASTNNYPLGSFKSTLTIKPGLMGDVNADDVVNITDFTSTATYILTNGSSPKTFLRANADMNGDGSVNVTDMTGIATVIINNQEQGGEGANQAPRKKSPRKVATDVSELANAIYVAPMTVVPGSQAVLSVNLKNEEPTNGFSFHVHLPEGWTFAQEDGIYLAELSTERTTKRKTDYFNSALKADGSLEVLCTSTTENPSTPGRVWDIEGNDGEVVLITVNIPADCDPGVYEVTITDGLINKTVERGDNFDLVSVYPDPTTSEITVALPEVTILDENSTDVPEATDGPVDLLVKRTLKAGQWSTICLPFNMTKEQLYAAFGDDVELNNFVSYEVTEDEVTGDIVGIQVEFVPLDPANGLEANYPCLIKVSENIDEFTLTAQVDPDEEEAVVEFDNGKSGSRRVVWGTLKGTYHAETVVPATDLFLSDNKFYYSAGLTKMKAFRAYFDFVDVLTSLEDAGANISLSFDGTTGIRDIAVDAESTEGVYTLQGQYLGRDVDVKSLPRGIYIVNGKKLVKK